jgi:hypothetical protein
MILMEILRKSRKNLSQDSEAYTITCISCYEGIKESLPSENVSTERVNRNCR